jgi:hypothetical protein
MDMLLKSSISCVEGIYRTLGIELFVFVWFEFEKSDVDTGLTDNGVTKTDVWTALGLELFEFEISDVGTGLGVNVVTV